MKKILLIDLCFFEGHHETYFMEILSALTQNGYFVYASSANNQKLLENIQTAQLQQCQVIELNLSPIDKGLNRLAQFLDRFVSQLPFRHITHFSSIFTLIATRRLMVQVGMEIPVFFAHADSALPAIPTWMSKRLLPSQWIGLYIWPSFKSSTGIGWQQSRKRFLAEKNLSLDSCKAALVLEPIYQLFYQKRFDQPTIIHLPELICPSFKSANGTANLDLSEAIKQTAAGRKIISILGSLTRKKNLLLFLEAFSKLDPNEYFAVIVGRLKQAQHSPEELARIEYLTGKVSSNAFIRLDYYIPDEVVFDRLIQLSDVLFLHYQDHPFSSNLLTRAITQRKPVIVSRGYVMERTMKTYAWEAVVTDDPDDVAQTIQYLTTHFQINEEKYTEFMKAHSNQQFEAALLRSCSLLTRAQSEELAEYRSLAHEYSNGPKKFC